MTIHGTGDSEVTLVPSPLGTLVARLTVEADGDSVSISITSNHLQALESLVRAVRLELDARSVG